MEQNPDDLDYSNYHSILPHEYPLFQNYQLIGDSQLVRFSELFLNCKRQYLSGSSGRVGYCIGGQRAEQLCQHLTLKTWPVYKNVILLIGTNDIKDSTDVSQWKESVKKIVDLFVSYNVQSLILLTVPPIPKLWHHVQHWTLFIEYNEFLCSLEKKYKDSFSSLKLIDISSIFLTNESDSSEPNKLNLYVISPARDGIDYYDEEFMMTNFRKHKFGTADSTEMKDNSYLKQNISLFDTMNMRYKLMSCFRGNTNDQDISINRERFDLIGVTLNDVWNIKCNILNIGNEEYMYSLRHAFQKFLSHLHQEPQRQRHKRFSSGDISTWSVPESPIPSKIPRGECRSFEDNEHDLSGVYCRSFEGSSEKQATSKSGEKKEPNAASIPSLRQVKRPTREVYQVKTSAKIALLSKHGNIDESGKSANENKIQYDPSMQGISVTLDNQKNTSVTKIKTTLGRETISKFTPRQVILNKTRERMSHSSGTTESDTSSETIDSANDKEGNNLKPTPKKRRERSFRDVLSLIQNTLLSLKVENGATPLSDSKTRKKLRVESPFIKTHVSCENETNSSSDSQLKKTQNNKPVALSETKQMQCSASLNNQRKVTVLPNTQYDLRENIMVTYVTNNLTTSKTCNTKGEMCTMKIQHRELGLTESKLTNDPLPDTSSPTNLFSKRKYRENQARNLYQDMENDGTSKYSNITNNTVHYTIPGLSKTYEDVNKNYNTPYTKMNTSTDSLNSALDTILPGDTSRRNVEPSNSELEVTQSAEETSRFILNIDYLTSEEKALMELKQSKKETIFHREKAHSGYDRLFLLRSNTIQFFQYVQAVCQYDSNYDINPIDERVFYSQIRTLRSPSACELESKFYTSMLGRFEFYKFIKYISLNYVVPKMFSNQFKNVIFTSLLDKNSNCANYIIRNLDLSVYETHFSRLPSTPLNKSPKVDLIHLNEKGFELLKNCLTQAITQIRRESNF